MILLSGCTGNKNTKIQESTQLQFSRLSSDGADAGFTIISKSTQVRAGEDASITIKGVPGTIYYISSTYLRGRRMVTTMQNITAPEDGIVTFKWNISKDTAPGTYPVVISGNGKTIRDQYTVSQ